MGGKKLIWTYRIKGENKSRCKSCSKYVNASPLNSCTSNDHQLSYQRKREYQTQLYSTEEYKVKMFNYDKIRRDNWSSNVINYYGGKCACCGFADVNLKVNGRRFLQIDHIAGGGRKHRQIEGYCNLARWLYEHDYPEGYRVLCAGCNVSIEANAQKCVLHQ